MANFLFQLTSNDKWIIRGTGRKVQAGTMLGPFLELSGFIDDNVSMLPWQQWHNWMQCLILYMQDQVKEHYLSNIIMSADEACSVGATIVQRLHLAKVSPAHPDTPTHTIVHVCTVYVVTCIPFPWQLLGPA